MASDRHKRSAKQSQWTKGEPTRTYQLVGCYSCSRSRRGRKRCLSSAKFLGEPDEKSSGPTDVAEPIHVFVLDHFADKLRAALAESGERIVNIVHGEHDAEVAQSVHRGVPVIGDRRGREKAREFEPAVAVRRAHHGDLDALVTQSSDAPRPVSFERALPFELEAKLAKELNLRSQAVDDNAYVIHPLKRHVPTVQSNLGPSVAQQRGT